METRMRYFKAYLRNKNRIRPAILNGHLLRRATHDLDAFQAFRRENLAHISMRLDGDDLEAFLSRRQSLSEFASAGSEVNDASTALAGYAALLEEVLDAVCRVRGTMSIVGGGVGEAGLGFLVDL